MAAAVEAVRAAGPDFAVDDVARSAGVSKTVIYRYFTDKDELVDAVLERISTVILLPRLLGQLAVEHADDRAALRAVIAAFVALIEDEPELYRFAYAHAGRSGRADLVAATEHEIAEALAAVMSARLADAGRPTGAARTWAYGVRRHGPARRALVVHRPQRARARAGRAAHRPGRRRAVHACSRRCAAEP